MTTKSGKMVGGGLLDKSSDLIKTRRGWMNGVWSGGWTGGHVFLQWVRLIFSV